MNPYPGCYTHRFRMLYRRLLRAHRNLPLEMRRLGDEYVKAEFRRHKTVTNPSHVMGFLTQWKVYLDELVLASTINRSGEGDTNYFPGKKLDQTVFEKMSNEQLGQLYELRQATKDVWRPSREQDEVEGPRTNDSPIEKS